jgi:hypothetical protein
MGGYSSGRRDGGPLVEDGWKLDLSHCVRNGLILPGRYVAGSMKWTLTSTARSTGAKVERDYRVPLETNRPNYGGLRWRFVCPLSGRRARVLYLPGSGGSVFVNRQAWRLACQSQRQGVEDRAVERSLKASKRLGVEDRNMLEMPHCPRTKWMRQRTHRRLVGVIRKCHRMQMAYMARRRPGVRPHKSSHNSAAERGASPCSYCGGCDANTPGGPPCTCASDGQTTDNQRRVLMEVAGRRGWTVATTYEGAGISGVKGRDKRPGFDAMLRDATRRRFDVLLFWSMDRLDRSTAAVMNSAGRVGRGRGRDLCGQGSYGRNHAARARNVADGRGVRRA